MVPPGEQILPDFTGDGELEVFFRISLQMLCIAGMDGYFKRVNPAFEKTLGYSAEELLARPFIDFVHPEDRQATVAAVSELARGGQVCRFENRYRCRDGSWRWLSWMAAPGGHNRVYAVASDVTEQKAADASLRQSQQRYRQLLEAITTYTYSVEVRNGVAVGSTHGPGVQSVTGFAPEEFQRDPYLWFRMIHPDDREMVRGHVARVLAGEAVAPIEHRIQHSAGAVRWVVDTIIPHCDSAGALARYDGVVQDITDRKRIEERLRLLVECAPDAIVVADASGRIVHVNQKTESVFGYTRAELLGQSVELLIPERLRGRHIGHRRDFVAARASRAMGDRPDLPCRRKDGSEFPGEISLSTIGDGDQTLVYTSIRDVTELRAVQARNRDNEVHQLAARRIQQRFLPGEPPQLRGFDVAGGYHPAATTGGDMYDYIPLADGSLGLAIGDVSGHGISAALIMASAHAYLRVLAASCSDVGAILQRVNAILAAETEDTRFVTLLMGRLEGEARRFTYSSAGHTTGYVFGLAGNVRMELESTAMPLGIFPNEQFPCVGPIPLQDGDVLLLLTDGVLEALNAADEQFGIRRVLGIVRANLHLPAAQIVDALYREVLAFTGHVTPDDDVTVLIVKTG